MADEYQLSLYKNGAALPPAYSDGNQDTGGPTPASGSPLDMNNDGFITDDEKDADGDGLGNWDEAHGRLTMKWWAGVFISEPHVLRPRGSGRDDDERALDDRPRHRR